MVKGNKICKYLAKVIDSGVFGREKPIVNGDVITFESMMGKFSYQINDDGSVNVLWNDPSTYDLDDMDMESEEELAEYIKENSHFNSVQELAESGDSWFCDLYQRDIDHINKIINS